MKLSFPPQNLLFGVILGCLVVVCAKLTLLVLAMGLSGMSLTNLAVIGSLQYEVGRSALKRPETIFLGFAQH